MPSIPKQPFPVHRARQYLEPGPVVLVSSHWAGKSNIMTLGWHTIMEFSPLLVGCMISAGNHSFGMSRECVINLPTADMVDVVSNIGNSTGAEIDKFAEFGLTAEAAETVAAPIIGECHAAFECRLSDDAVVESYNFFIFEIIRAHVAPEPEHPKTLHYKGGGTFMVSGDIIERKELFTKVS